MRKSAFLSSLVMVLAVATACGRTSTPMVASTEPGPATGPTPEPTPEPTPAAGGMDREALANLEYISEFTLAGRAALANGEYREPAAPGSATETVVKLTEYVSAGQLSGGQEAAAVILVTDPGGSGTFCDLAVVIEEDGRLVNVATTMLGDRVQVNSLGIENGEIVVDMVTHGPDDPMCCPTQQEVRTYALQGAELVQISSSLAEPEISDEPAGEGDKGTRRQGDQRLYVNEEYGYQFSYPSSAVITERGVMGFPGDELSEGMSPDEYIAQLQETYGDKLCVRVDYGLGYVNITAPPNADGRFGPCGRTGAAYEIIDKSETVVIAGQTYTAQGFDEVGPGETLNYRNETLWVGLPDGTVIEYGAAPSEAATFEDYVKTTRGALLQIVASYTPDEPLPAPDTSSAVQDDPYAGWESYVSADYGFSFRHPSYWTVQDEPHWLRLSYGTLAVDVWTMRAMESIQIGPGGLPAGDFEERGTVAFMGQEVPRVMLVYEGKDKGVLYGGTPGIQVDELMFVIAFTDLGEPNTDYRLIDLPDALQAEVDQIVESFERVSPQ